MPKLSKRLATLFAELRRRKVVRISIAYGVFAGAAFQLADPVGRALRLPDWTLTAALIALAAGFPLVVILAWTFDITRDSSAPAPQETVAPDPRRESNLYQIAAPVTQLVGRDDDLASALQLLEQPECRVLTLTGPGGIGKTRLAEEIGARTGGRYRNGVCFVPLAGIEAIEALPAALADALGFDLASQQKASRQLADFLQEKSLLLILDNFEQIIDGADLLTEIVTRARDVRIVVTSRRRLRITGEAVLQLDALSLPQAGMPPEDSEAGRFFLQIAQRNDPQFRPDAAASAAITRICRVADGIPLAIELAAASVGVLTCEEIANELEQSHEVLLGARRDLPPRHRSLHAVFESSWRLLDREERRVLRKLSVFRSGFDADAARYVAGAGVQLLGRLVEVSLLQRSAQRGFEMLEVLRQFAAEKLEAKREEADELRTRHSSYFLSALGEVGKLPDGRARNEAIERLAQRNADIRTAWLRAVEDGRHDDLRDAAPAFYHLLDARGRSAEGVQLFGHALSVVRQAAQNGNAAAQRALPRLLTRQAGFLTEIGERSEASDLLAEALVLLRAEDDRAEIAFALYKQCGLARASGDFHSTSVTECLELYRALGDVAGIARALNSLGAAVWSRGEYEQAERMYEESIALFRQSGLEAEAWAAVNNLAGVATVRGDWPRARKILEDELSVARKRMNPRALNYLLTNLGYIASRSGDMEAARTYLAEGAALAREMGFRALLAYSLNTIANVQMQSANLNAAADSFREALEVALDAEEGPLVTTILVGIAQLHLRREDPQRAAMLLTAVQAHPSCDEETRANARSLLGGLKLDEGATARIPLETAIQIALEKESAAVSA
jgi:predicted ATPase